MSQPSEPRPTPFAFAFLGDLTWTTATPNYRVDFSFVAPVSAPKNSRSVATSPIVLQRVGEMALAGVGTL